MKTFKFAVAVTIAVSSFYSTAIAYQVNGNDGSKCEAMARLKQAAPVQVQQPTQPLPSVEKAMSANGAPVNPSYN